MMRQNLKLANFTIIVTIKSINNNEFNSKTKTQRY